MWELEDRLVIVAIMGMKRFSFTEKRKWKWNEPKSVHWWVRWNWRLKEEKVDENEKWMGCIHQSAFLTWSFKTRPSCTRPYYLGNLKFNMKIFICKVLIILQFFMFLNVHLFSHSVFISLLTLKTFTGLDEKWWKLPKISLFKHFSSLFLQLLSTRIKKSIKFCEKKNIKDIEWTFMHVNSNKIHKRQ